MRNFLRKLLFRPLPVEIIWHENKRSYLSFRHNHGKIVVRLHKLFQGASPEVYQALLRYVREGDSEGRHIIRKVAYDYFSQHRRPSDLLESRGKVYDLATIYRDLKEKFFSPEYEAAIGWANLPRSSRFRHITFGTYDRHRNQIRIHPLLDDAEVPLYFISFIVYHEMLHAVCLPQLNGRRCSIHTKEFKERERAFPHYAAAKAWEKKSLLFFRRQGKRIIECKS